MCRADNLTTIMCQLLEIWEPQPPGILQACDRPEQGWCHLLHKKWHSTFSLSLSLSLISCNHLIMYSNAASQVTCSYCCQPISITTLADRLLKLKSTNWFKPTWYRNITQNFRMAGQVSTDMGNEFKTLQSHFEPTSDFC